MAVTAKPPAQVFKKYFTAGKNFRLKSKIVPFSTIFNEFLSSNIRIYCSLKSFWRLVCSCSLQDKVLIV